MPGKGDLDKRLKFWGWRKVENRNDFWVYKDKNSRGAVHWYGGGLVRLYLKGEVMAARCKELFCRAFRWFIPEQISKYLDCPLKEVSKKWTFDLDAPVPIFDIRKFERSHGLIIHTDLSDPKSLHVTENRPLWFDQLELITDGFTSVLDQLATQIQEHLKLIKMWQQEAEQQRQKPKKSFCKKLLGKYSFEEKNGGI